MQASVHRTFAWFTAQIGVAQIGVAQCRPEHVRTEHPDFERSRCVSRIDAFGDCCTASHMSHTARRTPGIQAKPLWVTLRRFRGLLYGYVGLANLLKTSPHDLSALPLCNVTHPTCGPQLDGTTGAARTWEVCCTQRACRQWMAKARL